MNGKARKGFVRYNLPTYLAREHMIAQGHSVLGNLLLRQLSRHARSARLEIYNAQKEGNGASVEITAWYPTQKTAASSERLG